MHSGTVVVHDRIVLQPHPREKHRKTVFACPRGMSRREIVLALNETWHRSFRELGPFVLIAIHAETGDLIVAGE
jgi:hypothetical protein